MVSALANEAVFFSLRAYRPISFSWTNGRRVGSRGTQVFPSLAVWECWRWAPRWATSQIFAKRI